METLPTQTPRGESSSLRQSAWAGNPPASYRKPPPRRRHHDPFPLAPPPPTSPMHATPPPLPSPPQSVSPFCAPHTWKINGIAASASKDFTFVCAQVQIFTVSHSEVYQLAVCVMAFGQLTHTATAPTGFFLGVKEVRVRQFDSVTQKVVMTSPTFCHERPLRQCQAIHCDS